MRILFRPLAPIIAAAAFILAGGSSVLAAAEPSSVPLDASWCYQSGSVERCYDIDGTMRFLDTAAGSSVTVNEIVRTTTYESGQYAGSTMSEQMSRGWFQADGTVVIDTVIHTRSTTGDDACAYRMVLRLVDYEATVYEVSQTCG